MGIGQKQIREMERGKAYYEMYETIEGLRRLKRLESTLSTLEVEIEELKRELSRLECVEVYEKEKEYSSEIHVAFEDDILESFIMEEIEDLISLYDSIKEIKRCERGIVILF